MSGELTYTVTLPISQIQADMAGMPVEWLERAVKAVGVPAGQVGFVSTPMTHVENQPLSELLPCPMCGDPMQYVFGTVRHREQGDCPIGAYAWGGEKSIERWNRRALPSEGEAVAYMPRRIHS